jgi:hypothetical protein
MEQVDFLVGLSKSPRDTSDRSNTWQVQVLTSLLSSSSITEDIKISQRPFLKLESGLPRDSASAGFEYEDLASTRADFRYSSQHLRPHTPRLFTRLSRHFGWIGRCSWKRTTPLRTVETVQSDLYECRRPSHPGLGPLAAWITPRADQVLLS